MAKKQSKWAHVPKHHAQVLKVMREVLSTERWQKPFTDDALAAEICKRGVYATHNIVNAVRVRNHIPNAMMRQLELFAMQGGAR